MIESDGPTQERVQRDRVAYHEAGHAVVAFALGIPFTHVTIEADNESLGMVSTLLGDEWTPYDDGADDVLWKHFLVTVAGQAAEELALGTAASWEAPELAGDREALFLIAEWLQGPNDVDALERASEEATAILRRDWVSVQRLQTELVSQGCLAWEQCLELLNN